MTCGDTSITLTGVTGCCNSIVRAEQLARTTYHLFNDGTTDHIMLNNILSLHTKQFHLETILIGNKTSLEISRSTWNCCQLSSDTTTGTALSRTEALVALKQDVLNLGCNGIHYL